MAGSSGGAGYLRSARDGVNDVYDLKRLDSAMPSAGVQEVVAGGLYATLTKYERYASHESNPHEGCAFGPDIEWATSCAGRVTVTWIGQWMSSIRDPTGRARTAT